MIKKETLADLTLLFVAMAWGSNFVVIKDALDHVPPFTYLSVRFTLAAVITALIFWKKVKLITRDDLIAGSIIGFFLFSSFAAQTIGLIYTTPGKSGFITSIYVILVPFMYYFITKELPGFWSIVAAILAVIGLALLSIQESLTINFGDLLTLVCAFLFAGHIVSIGIFAPKRDPIILNIIQFAFTAVVTTLVMLIWEPEFTPLTGRVWGAVFYGVIVCTIGAFGLQTVAQKYTSASRTALILCLESVFAVIFSYFFWGEELTFRIILGCALIFIGIILTELKPSFTKFKRTTPKQDAD